MRIPVTAFLLSLFANPTGAQEAGYSSSQILHRLQRLNTAATVLYIAAHPDDENTRLISYLVNERHFRTAYLSLTRGEGGQNLIGSEQGPPLGVIRTYELHAARSVDGGEQYFSGAADFGYSKSPEETLQKWNRDTVLKEMTLVIRKLKPDVIICRFPTTGEGGHGHHTASAMLALDAAAAAADSSKFPSQVESYGAWKCRRIYWNTFNFSSANTVGPGQFTLDVGGYNTLLGKSYGEIASQSRSMHKSQGFGSVAQRGASTENFRLLRGDSLGPDLFAGIEAGLQRIPGLKKTSKLIRQCIDAFDPLAPEKSVQRLAQIRRQLFSIKTADRFTNHWVREKLAECERLILACTGLWLDAACTTPTALPGSTLQVKTTALNRSGQPVRLVTVAVADKKNDPATDLVSNVSFTNAIELKVASDKKITEHFWKNDQMTTSEFIRSEYSGNSASPPAYEAIFVLSIAGEEMTFRRPVMFRRGDPVKGEVSHPLYVAPPLEIGFEENVYVAKKGKAEKIKLTVSSNADNLSCIIRITGRDMSIDRFDSIVQFEKAGEKKTIELFADSLAETGTISAVALAAGTRYDSRAGWIDVDHIPKQIVYSRAEAIVIDPDLAPGVKNVAYIPGAGDDVARCLIQAGYEVTVIDAEKIGSFSLQQFDAVVTGIRAFNTNELLHEKMTTLLSYVENGGNLIVQYNTNSRVGPLSFVPGPFPYTITRQRVTDEHAEVKFLEPDHVSLHFPNKITSRDFEGWVQERGIYFAESKDERYKKILSMSDPAEKELDGSLLIARYGKGNFVYTGLAFFRQLPAGVPGAYRLFSNLLSLPAAEKK